ncbi:RagB/SusD family nutrient uptake outer membrane protein, partial [Shewanella algae]
MNMVRNRASANPTATQFTLASFNTVTDLVAAILVERRIEFLAEGKRWADIHRGIFDPIASLRTAGIPAKVVNGNTGMGQYGIGLPVTPGQP